jgi:Fur family ferric uptake transcriptional regulator
MANDHRTDYATLLRRRGFRMTPQRQFILDAIGEGHGHTTFDEIFARVQAHAPAMNRTTLYRTLEFLHHQRLVFSAEIGGQTVYEIAGDELHHHLVCVNCGATEQLAHEAVKPFFSRIERDRGFEVLTNHLALFGLCRECRQSQKTRRRTMDDGRQTLVADE